MDWLDYYTMGNSYANQCYHLLGLQVFEDKQRSVSIFESALKLDFRVILQWDFNHRPNEEKAEQSEQEMDREIFDSYDTDKDGRLDANELKHFLKDMECINEHDSESLKNDLVNKLMDDIDENRDKKISFQEYRNYTDKL